MAVGRLRTGPLFELQKDYLQRLRAHIKLIEVEARGVPEGQKKEAEGNLLRQYITSHVHVVALDERGPNLSSRALAKYMEELAKPAVFILGGAEGLHASILMASHAQLSFGQLTWPHMLARVMLLEQLYRVQQIHRNHPYHKE